MYVPSDLKTMGPRTINAMDRVANGMNVLYGEIAQYEETGDGSEFKDNEEFFNALVKSMKRDLIRSYAFLIAIEQGTRHPAVVMKSFMDDKKEIGF